MTHRVQYNPYLHAATHYRLLVEALLLDGGERPLPKIAIPNSQNTLPQYTPSPTAVQYVQARWAACAGEKTGPRILFNPNASDIMPLRKWPLERFEELGRRLLALDGQLTIMIMGAEAERGAAEELRTALNSPRVGSLAGGTTLDELLALCAVSDVLVTNDSGPAHFATLTPINVVVLFGPETPKRYAPLGPRSHVLWAELACSPCIHPFNHRVSPCRQNRCMSDITVDEVLRVVWECIQNRTKQ